MRHETNSAFPLSPDPAGLYPPSVKPAARALPLLPTIFRFVRNPLRSLPRAVYEQPLTTYGKRRPLVVWVTGPEYLEQVLIKQADLFPKTRLDKRVLRPMVGQGLLTADGDHWRWQRKMAAPMFRPNDVLDYVPTIVEAAEEQIARWRAAGPCHVEAVDQDMTETTFAVIARTVLAGIDESEGDAIKRSGHDYIDPIMWSAAAALLLWPEHYWHPYYFKMKRAAAAGRATVQRLLDKRRAQGLDGDDLVARMLKARHPDTGALMLDDEIVDNLATFLLAGHETTAKALTWTLYLLARAPEWQERVRDEVQRVTNGEPVGADDIPRLAITQRVLKEAMRLYPPVPVMTRVNREAARIGDVELPSSALIVIPVFAIHRHKTQWDDPDRFDPDRFLPEREAAHHRMQFIPFGAGPRVCIGAAFAMTEATVVLATLLQKVRFEWDGAHLPEPVSRVTLHPKGGMPLTVVML